MNRAVAKEPHPSEVDHVDFIEFYEGAIDAATCNAAIGLFEDSELAVRGCTGSGVDTDVKDSWDIEIGGRPEWYVLEQSLLGVVANHLRTYLRKYPHVLLAPLTLKCPDPETGRHRRVTADDMQSLDDKALNRLIERTLRLGAVNVQKYNADEGGYPCWHCELYPAPGTEEPLRRVLLWTVYLNEGFSGGETEFLHQRRSIAPSTGALLIAPTAFTHTHRGNTPRGGDKYIATSWILFQPTEALYPAGTR